MSAFQMLGVGQHLVVGKTSQSIQVAAGASKEAGAPGMTAVRVVATSGMLWLAFGDGTVSADDKTGIALGAGRSEIFIVPDLSTHLAFYSDGGDVSVSVAMGRLIS